MWDDGPLATTADAAREYHNQGLQCPYDCWRCQPAEPDIIGEWLVTLADGCTTTDYRSDGDRHPQPSTGGQCAHGWQPAAAAIEFLGLPYIRWPDPPTDPTDPWAVTDDCPF